MTLNVGDTVLVTDMVAGLHWAGRLVSFDTEPYDDGRAWLHLNMMGSHLPQMYRLSEMTPLSGPEAAWHGFCPDCLGYGLAHMPDPDEMFTLMAFASCRTCGGSGRHGVSVAITRTVSSSEAQIKFDREKIDTWMCAVCRAGTEPTPQ